jgi:hypothetical protein
MGIAEGILIFRYCEDIGAVNIDESSDGRDGLVNEFVDFVGAGSQKTRSKFSNLVGEEKRWIMQAHLQTGLVVFFLFAHLIGSSQDDLSIVIF